MTGYDLTILFLKCLAGRLSARQDCRRLEYSVNIHIRDDGNTCITMDPAILVYPHGFNTDRNKGISIITWVCNIMNLSILEYKGSSVIIQGHPLIDGKYVYKLSWDGRRRSWFKF